MFQSWYATCPRGAEPALRDELQTIGAKGIRPAPGIVRFTGERETALRACLELRCAMRVLEPVGEFPAEDGDALYAGARTLAWESLLTPGQTFAVSASGKTPQLNHTHFVALRIKDAVCDVLREERGERPDVDPQRPDVLLIAHLANGRCSLSLDLAGDLLSNRGYRVRTVEAPLREALAAAVVRLSGWDGQAPLHDPVCGSGTLAIEAALFALGRAPGETRRLACESWPRTAAHDGPVLARLRAELAGRARERRTSPVPPILASDRDEGAVSAAQANVQAAGLSESIRVFQADARAIEPLSPPGQLLLNVPYGERLEAGGRKQLKSFYHSLGEALGKLAGHRAAVLSASDDFESAFGIRPRGRPSELWNGPLRCGLYLYDL
jgi:23S rRNA (guanine2445-N2)-methyltransferase / 23S rRNA (guanine2069-N7)-methyltransferase